MTLRRWRGCRAGIPCTTLHHSRCKSACKSARAIRDGSFVFVLPAEGVNIVANLHHVTHEQPRYLLLHDWGKGPASKLAASLKNTLALQKK
jgi:hypothetical protein